MLQLTRDEFFGDYYDYRPGEHVSFLGPTRYGKTFLAYQALDHAMAQNPELTVASLMPKPRDQATTAWAKQLNLRETPDWPPKKKWLESKPRGYVLWPHHNPSLSAEENREQIAGVMRKCLHQQYWKGNSITFADDVHIAAVLMGLNPELEQFWTAGGSNKAGVWSANQKPSGTLNSGSVSSFSYNAPTHLFLMRDPDVRNQRRLSEIGGIDPHELAGIVANLRMWNIHGNNVSEVLYLDRRGPYYATLLPW